MMRIFIIIIFVMSFVQSACSSCSENSNNAHDAGPDTSADTDTDTDTDADADTDTDTDTDTFSDAGPWEWTDLPTSEECGVGCAQLTYSGEVQFLKWDVWDDYLVYIDGDFHANIIDIANRKYLVIPIPIADCNIDGPDGDCIALDPAIYSNQVYYSLVTITPTRTTLVEADLLSHSQQILFQLTDEVGTSWEAQHEIDAYGSRVISQGGCDNSIVNELCFFPLSTPGEVNVLTGSHYGGYNSLWGDVAVWFTLDYEEDTFDIEGYNFASSEFFYITQDAETQLDPKIQGNTVVYMDLRFGDSNLDGNWNHSAVFAYDLTTTATKQITSGEWIAAYPDVYENLVVWLDYRASSNPNDAQSFDGVEIWGYNLTTETEFQVTNLPGRPKQTPRIWGDKVFVHMSKASGGDGIFMFDLPDGAK